MNPKTSYLFNYLSQDGTPLRFCRVSKGDLNTQRRWFAKRRPLNKLISVEVDWVSPMLDRMRRAGGEPWKRLQDKARWEQMTLSKVLIEYPSLRA